MKYVSVRHKPTHQNVWWFSVPAELENRVKVGSEVLCSTRKGTAPGRIVSILENVEQTDAEKIIGDHFPLKPLIATSTDFDINEIHIPLEYEMTTPDADKIKQRIKEFYSTGKFDTPIIFTPDGNLRDGYTAYLVARMFGHDTLRGFCVLD